jgi:hypothetical protein
MEERMHRSNGLLVALRRDYRLLLLLLLLASGLRVWIISHTAVAARDSIGFIRYAYCLEHQPWKQVLRDSLHPPLYPLTVLAVAVPARHLVHSADVLTMQYSAQAASALAGVLLVIPMFYLGKHLFDRRVGFWSALLFQCLPVGSHALSDGLTEGVFLLLTASFLLAAAHALRRRSALYFAICGACSGLAYLARPEGAALALVLGAVLVVYQLRPAWRWPGFQVRRCAAHLVGVALLFSVPYMCVIGGFTHKLSILWIMQKVGLVHHADDGHHRVGVEPRDREPQLAWADDLEERDTDSRPGPLPLAVIWAKWDWGWGGAGERHDCSLRWGANALLKELARGFHYVAWIPALFGLWWFRRRAWQTPLVAVITSLCLFYVVVLLLLGMVAGYISQRHSLVFVLCGAPWAVAGMLEMPRRMSVIGTWMRAPAAVINWGGQRRAVEVLFAAAIALYGVPASLQPLHPTRVGFREAGFWIASNLDPNDEVLDPFCWTNYYAGRVFANAQLPVDQTKVEPKYVVIDSIYSADHHSHLPDLEKAQRLAATGRLVYHWPVNCDAQQALVFVYQVSGGK